MDWLSKYFTTIDCWKKELVFDSPSVGRIRHVRGTIRVVPLLLSTLQVRTCIADGAVAYLALIVEESSRNKEIQEISMVEVFLKVFMEDLPRLPLNG